MIPKFRAFYDEMMVHNAAKVGNALYWNDGKCFDAFAFKQRNPAILMQCIGLKDMNNVDIYESDRVLVFGFGQGTVIWKVAAFGYMLHNGTFVSFWDNHNFNWTDDKSMEIKVVGNIYEDSELSGKR